MTIYHSYSNSIHISFAEAEKLENLPELDLIYHYGKLLIVTSDHYNLLALYWEIFFFDFSHFSSGQKAEELLQETPQLARHLNFRQLTNRADKFDKVSIFRKLIEISLQFDLSEEQKRLAFDALLVFQCKYIIGNFVILLYFCQLLSLLPLFSILVNFCNFVNFCHSRNFFQFL